MAIHFVGSYFSVMKNAFFLPMCFIATIKKTKLGRVTDGMEAIFFPPQKSVTIFVMILLLQ